MITLAASPQAADALALVRDLQQRMVAAMQRLGGVFTRSEWLRDGGRHGGGDRWSAGDGVFDRASVNVSQVHYDDDPGKKLASATALSTIIHPAHPRAPSVHMHVSWTEMRDGESYWRIMADLNPSIPDAAATARFVAALRGVAPDVFDEAAAQGDRYFWIPALDRHRGVAHFYLESYRTGDLARDAALARRVIEAAIDVYAELVREVQGEASEAERAEQRAYHTAYLFQVLTLDRGTTSGLLVHDQNDVGILGSLPSRIDRARLASWAARVAPPIDALVRALVEALPVDGAVSADTKQALAAVVRAFYRAHPEALALQASGNVIPPTVGNHR